MNTTNNYHDFIIGQIKLEIEDDQHNLISRDLISSYAKSKQNQDLIINQSTAVKSLQSQCIPAVLAHLQNKKIKTLESLTNVTQSLLLAEVDDISKWLEIKKTMGIHAKNEFALSVLGQSSLTKIQYEELKKIYSSDEKCLLAHLFDQVWLSFSEEEKLGLIAKYRNCHSGKIHFKALSNEIPHKMAKFLLSEGFVIGSTYVVGGLAMLILQFTIAAIYIRVLAWFAGVSLKPNQDVILDPIFDYYLFKNKYTTVSLEAIPIIILTFCPFYFMCKGTLNSKISTFDTWANMKRKHAFKALPHQWQSLPNCWESSLKQAWIQKHI